MIRIDKDQEILDNENLRVAAPSGDYADTALIEFYDIGNPEINAGSYQAQCIKYGNLVYKFNDLEELGEEILKIDPESTHEAASFVRMSKELLMRMKGGTLDSNSLDQILEKEKIEKVKKDIPTITPTATSTIPVTNVSTTTPSISPTVPVTPPTTPINTTSPSDVLPTSKNATKTDIPIIIDSQKSIDSTLTAE